MADETVRIAGDAEVAALLGLEPLEQSASSDSEQVPELDALVGRRVREARRRSGLDAAALAEQVGLTRDKLSKIENGRRRVSPRELPALARALHVSLPTLLGAAGATRPALALAHRVAATAPGSATSGARARAIEILQAESRLSKHAELPPRQLSPGGAAIERLVATNFATAPRTAPEAQRQGRVLAEEVRRILEFGIAEIGDLPALAEMHFAADVVLSPLGEGSDGLCAHDGEAALLVVNTDYPTGRTRFTLAHELGHHLLRDPRDVIEEQYGDMFATSYLERRVNAFAGHLLLPVKAVTATLAWLGCGRDDLSVANARGRTALGYLMLRYGVSLPCALSQIVEAGFLTVPAKTDLTDKLRAGELIRAARHLISESPGPEKTTREQRPPARLVTVAVEAARAGYIGMNTVAVWEAYRKVRANRGAPGVDEVSLAEFEEDLKGNLYKIWNRMSSGTYFPPPVRAVEIPKDHGRGVRVLGVPRTRHSRSWGSSSGSAGCAPGPGRCSPGSTRRPARTP